jgi:MFS family permease
MFPMETRAMAIAFFYATGTIVGGFGGPLLFGALIQSGEPSQIFIGYVVGAVVMIIGLIQATMGVEAARRDLEDIAPPLSAAGEELEEPGEQADPYTVAPEEGRKQPAAPTGRRFERDDATGERPVTPVSATPADAVGEPRDTPRTRPTGGQ